MGSSPLSLLAVINSGEIVDREVVSGVVSSHLVAAQLRHLALPIFTISR